MKSPEQQAISTAIIRLMTGVVYQETHEAEWRTLERNLADVRDHFTTIGVDVIIDEVEGYAYLRSSAEEDGEEPLPRLVRRRALSYNLSLLLLLLRKRLAEFEAVEGEGKLVLDRDHIVEMLRLFLPDSTNEARIISSIDSAINQAAKLGFLKGLSRGRSAAIGESTAWEVRRILKAYVDAETMANFSDRLSEYTRTSATDTENRGDAGDDPEPALATVMPESRGADE